MFSKARSLFNSARIMPTYNGPTLPTAIHASQNLAASGSGAREEGIFANGCFWGGEHMIRKHMSKGLIDVKVGYIGGSIENPNYRQVCSGTTQHAEAYRVVFDPAVVSYAEFTEFFFRMHDPTQVDRQGPDRGTQYRSAIFTLSDEQDRVANKVRDEVQDEHYKGSMIATTIEPAGKWWDAEDYHQQYLDNNPGGYECPSHVLHW
ncbi:hypothetical protein JCM11491_004823 [Sporobolomyces phaffii]